MADEAMRADTIEADALAHWYFHTTNLYVPIMQAYQGMNMHWNRFVERDCAMAGYFCRQFGGGGGPPATVCPAAAVIHPLVIDCI